MMLALGRLHMNEFALQPQHHYVLRLVDAPDVPPGGVINCMTFANCSSTMRALHAPVAKLDKALVYETRDSRFESWRVRHLSFRKPYDTWLSAITHYTLGLLTRPAVRG